MITVIIGIQHLKRIAVLFDHAENLLAVQRIFGSFHNFKDFSELGDTMVVYRITLQYVLFEHGVCPLAELYAAF